jgi:acetyl esterase
MPLDPQAKAFLDTLKATRAPGFEKLPIPLARGAFFALRRLAGPVERVAHVKDETIPGNLSVRVYRPSHAAVQPALIYFHGGGWVLGGLDTVDGHCRRLANAARCIVVSVAYRLAPEHKFPIPSEDCYHATRYVAENAQALGIDPDRIAVGGDSAGGNLAAVVSLMSRDRGGPKLSFQLLIYPVTDSTMDTPSHREFASGYMLTRAEMLWFRNHYLPRLEEGLNPFAAPIRAKDLRGLPPAWVLTAEYDPLRDEGEAFAKRLREAGVPAKVHRYDGMIHGFFQMSGIMNQAKTAIGDAAEALRDAWRT